MLFSPYLQVYDPPSTAAWLVDRWFMNRALDLNFLVGQNLQENSASCLSVIELPPELGGIAWAMAHTEITNMELMQTKLHLRTKW